MRKQIEDECSWCAGTYSKDLSEYKRNKKLSRKSYCSLECKASAEMGNNILPYVGKHIPQGYNKSDEYSKFREYIRRAIRRKHNCTITVEDLQEQWKNQEGKCVYLGIPLTLWDRKQGGRSNILTTASLDRMDPTKGYIPGNIEFVSICMNYMKNDLSKPGFQELLDTIKPLI